MCKQLAKATYRLAAHQVDIQVRQIQIQIVVHVVAV